MIPAQVLPLPAIHPTGERVLYGDYLLNAQGEDVVAGIRNTEKIETLGRDLPEANKQFLEIVKNLEKHYHDMQDVEFTIERGQLWMLQCRNGKRTASAAVKIAVDMVNEGLITKEEAIKRVTTGRCRYHAYTRNSQLDTKAKAKKDGFFTCKRCKCFSWCCGWSDLL